MFMQNAFTDFGTSMTNSLLYASYHHSRTCLEFGDDLNKFIDSLRYFGFEKPRYAESTFARTEALVLDVPMRVPKTGVSIGVFHDFFSHQKSDEQKAIFLAFLALKSIIGRKPYCKLTNQYLIARMGGFASLKDTPTLLPAKLEYWNTRRRLDRIKTELEQNWNVNIYGYRMRGFYASIDAQCPRSKLIEVAEKNRKANATKIIRKLNEEIRKEVLSRI
jgi:hypothetical protein